LWWLLWLLLVPVVWIGLQTLLLGATLSPKTTGRFYLRSQLKRAGVPHFVPEAAVRELVSQAVSQAKTFSKMMSQGGGGRLSMRTEMVNFLDGMVTQAVEWTRPTGLPARETDSVPKVLQRHGVRRGAAGRPP
jgi:hypothetical protein